MKIMISKRKIILILIIVCILLIGLFFYEYLPYKETKTHCLNYVVYSPERKAYRWKYEDMDEWYKSSKEAMNACINGSEWIYK